MSKPKKKRVELNLNLNRIDELEIVNFVESVYAEKKIPIARQFKEAMQFYMDNKDAIHTMDISANELDDLPNVTESEPIKDTPTEPMSFGGFQGMSSD